MKNAILVLAIAVATFVTGCQGNIATNPPTEKPSVGNQRSTKQHGDIILPVNIIPLNSVLREPRGFNAFTEVNGQVAYTITVVPRDPIPPNPEWSLSITFALEAELKPFVAEGPVWRLSNYSSNDFPLEINDGAMLIVKKYMIEGRTDGVSLYLEFHVTQEALALSRMWLDSSNASRSEDES